METTQTAVDWLIQWMNQNQYYIGNDLLDAVEQAKQMEKEQIYDSYSSGAWYENQNIEKSAEQYYKETYGSNNQI